MSSGMWVRQSVHHYFTQSTWCGWGLSMILIFHLPFSSSSSLSPCHYHLHGRSWLELGASFLAQLVAFVEASLDASPITWLGILRWDDPKCGTWSIWNAWASLFLSSSWASQYLGNHFYGVPLHGNDSTWYEKASFGGSPLSSFLAFSRPLSSCSWSQGHTCHHSFFESSIWAQR